jgi:hypothetical protein
LVIPTELEIFCRKSPSFGHSYRTRNILTRFCCKSPSFGHSYRTINILTRSCRKSPSFCHSYRTRNILTRFVHIIQKQNWSHFTVVEIGWFLFVERLPDDSAERLSTVSSPFMVRKIILKGLFHKSELPMSKVFPFQNSGNFHLIQDLRH